MHEAARSGYVDHIRELVGAGAGLSPMCVGEGDTGFPIHVAMGEAIGLLLTLGAAINARDQDGRTPLHRKVINSYPYGIATLLKAGADPLPLDNEGKTPLDYIDSKSKRYQAVLDALAPAIAIQAELDHEEQTAPAAGSHRGTRL